jgi:excisionase family DNA binding protein
MDASANFTRPIMSQNLLPTSTHTAVPVEYLRVSDACRRFSVSRSWLYELIKENAIKSHCLRKLGNTRGARRINAESLRLFIESHKA